MGLQFVDLNADGHDDMVTATFDGSPHVAWGSEKGFKEPEVLQDSEGKRIILGSFWRNKTEKEKGKHLYGQTKGCGYRERCTSAICFDWDNDGDYDLLLGGKETGSIYLKMNEGTKEKASFSTSITPVMADGKKIADEFGLTTPKLVDWDRDGLMDLVVGTYGSSMKPESSGIYLYRNTGKLGAPKFAARRILVRAAELNQGEPLGPTWSLFPAIDDVDGDGDWDLVVGAFSHTISAKVEMSDEERVELSKLIDDYLKVKAQDDAIYQGAELAFRESDSLESGRARYEEFLKDHEDDLKKMRESSSALYKKIDAKRPLDYDGAYTWLYINKEKQAKAGEDPESATESK